MPALVRVLLALLTLTAIGWQLSIHIGLQFSVQNYFSYFTNLSNLFACVVLLASVRASNDVLRYVSTVNMTLVGLVFAILLRDVDLGSLRPWVNVVLHDVMPIAVLLDWFLAPPSRPLRAKHALLSLIFPAAYLVYVLVRGAAIDWYPYPFLNPANVGGYGTVALYALGITAGFLLASGALLVVGNRGARR